MTANPHHTTTAIDNDPVVVYDVMREAANRLTAVYVQAVRSGGEDRREAALGAIRALRAEVRAVDPSDIAAQKTKTAEFHARYGELIGR